MTTTAASEGWPRSRAIAIAKRVNAAVIVFVVLYAIVGVLQPSYLEPTGFMNFLRRSAPLAILASGQLFVLAAGGFDLSMSALVTLTVPASDQPPGASVPPGSRASRPGRGPARQRGGR